MIWVRPVANTRQRERGPSRPARVNTIDPCRAAYLLARLPVRPPSKQIIEGLKCQDSRNRFFHFALRLAN